MEGNEKEAVFACIQCGKCTGSCPEAGKTPLNIRIIVRRSQFGDRIDNSSIWYCSSCGACTIKCPRDVKPSELLFHIRSDLVESAEIPSNIQKALENTFIHKNPWGRARSKRANWQENLGFEVKHIKDSQKKRLLFSCCIHAYDPRCALIPQNVSKMLTQFGFEFGTLKEDEVCCGNEIKRLGEKGLFEELRDENLSNFENNGVKEIIALSPHCMNVMKNEYDRKDLKVMHYTQVLWDSLKEGLIKIEREYEKKVVYHDPCFLGKQNGIFEEPRNILKSIPGLKLLEFTRSRENSLCCEGGGGRMFYEVDIHYERNAKIRVSEAEKMGAEIIAVACPFCLTTLEEVEGRKVEIKDISEILMEVIG